MEARFLIIKELNVPKDQFNNHGKYNYRTCEGILMALKPLLEKNEADLFLNDELIVLGGRFYVKATATIAKGTERVTADGYAREEEVLKGMNAAQITGSTSSYARKLALNALFLIDDSKDADSAPAANPQIEQADKEAWEIQLSACKNTDELNALFKQNEAVVKSDKNILALFTKRKGEIQNG